MKLCTNCHAKPLYAKGLCDTCYAYQHRTGRPRPPHLTRRQYDLNRRPRLSRAVRQVLKALEGGR
jgi:hypothetical protein